jgi:hypothetical protein
MYECTSLRIATETRPICNKAQHIFGLQSHIVMLGEDINGL